MLDGDKEVLLIPSMYSVQMKPYIKSNKVFIITDENILICQHLFRMWYKTFKALPTGTYNNSLDHGTDREELDIFDYNKNPGGFYIQTAFSEYFAIKLDNKQTKDLIQVTTNGLSLPLEEPVVHEEYNVKTFPHIMGWTNE